MMAQAVLAFVALLALGRPAAGAGKPLGNPPYAIAHRGLSGVYPEHSAKAYEAAIKAGADFIECDVVPTKDCQLLCRHEPNLDLSSDALEKFPALKKTFVIDGVNTTGVFSFDLTLDQIRTLRVKQVNPIRDQSYNGQFGMVTFEEYVKIAQGAPRAVGIYPETKNPTFFASLQAQGYFKCFNGKSFTEVLADALAKNGYNAPYGTRAWRRRPVFLQSFERSNLIAIAKKTKVPLVFLTDEFDLPIPGEAGTTYGDIYKSDSTLNELRKQGISGLGPWKNTLVSFTKDNRVKIEDIPVAKALLKRLHKKGFQVHIYTLRNEPVRPDGSGYLAWSYQADPVYEYDLLFKEVGVDGAFTDQAHTLARYLHGK